MHNFQEKTFALDFLTYVPSAQISISQKVIIALKTKSDVHFKTISFW